MIKTMLPVKASDSGVTAADNRRFIEAGLANKGYDANHLLEYLAQREIQAVTPPKANRVQQRKFDRHVYNDRNFVARFFCRLKQFRRTATRHDKLARNFFGMLSLACAYIWLA